MDSVIIFDLSGIFGMLDVETCCLALGQSPAVMIQC